VRTAGPRLQSVMPLQRIEPPTPQSVSLSPHLVVDGCLRPSEGSRPRFFAHLAAPSWISLRDIDIFGSLSDIVVDSRKLRPANPVGPHNSGPKPLRMVDHDMKRCRARQYCPRVERIHISQKILQGSAHSAGSFVSQCTTSRQNTP